MKTRIKNLFLLPALIAGLGLILAGRVTAQTFTNLHSFTTFSGSPSTNSDGANPQAGLILSGNTLYGTAYGAGSAGSGTVFKVNTNGTGFTVLHNFTALPPFPGPLYTNSDGATPYGELILSGNTLYGTASAGGTKGKGTVFAINTDGTGFTNLHNFTATSGSLSTNSDGANPYSGLILLENTLYGTAFYGGLSGNGTVFALQTNGIGFTNVHSFAPYNYNASFYETNSDGGNPYAGLILSGNTLYGTAAFGGTSANGTVFKVNIDGTGFTNLHNFPGIPNFSSPEGANPDAELILSGNTLFGTANSGGSANRGVVFAVNTDGSGFTNLHSFISASDGSYPYGALILSGNTLYGTASSGGSADWGTVFAMNTDGTDFTNLHNFNVNVSSNGANPQAGLILSDNVLYGTASQGGSSGNGYYGSVYSLSLVLLPPSPPFITTPPQNQYVFPGENATFTVLAGGDLPLSYQWRFNSADISSATQTSYTRSNVQSNDFGSYNVVVTNVYGSITSAVATLGYVLSPILTNEHLDDGTFTFTLNGNPPARNYLIQQATNLPNWSNVLTFSNISGSFSFTETNANGFFKVFRAKIVP